MLIKMLTATAAFSLVIGGGAALAAQSPSTSKTPMGPKQPIPYSQLDAYTKASPKLRASKDWWAGAPQAATGLSTDTAAAAPATASDPAATAPSSTSSGDTAVNPMPSAPPASLPQSLPSTPPTDSDPARAADPLPATPGTPPAVPPLQPK